MTKKRYVNITQETKNPCNAKTSGHPLKIKEVRSKKIRKLSAYTRALNVLTFQPSNHAEKAVHSRQETIFILRRGRHRR